MKLFVAPRWTVESLQLNFPSDMVSISFPWARLGLSVPRLVGGLQLHQHLARTFSLWSSVGVACGEDMFGPRQLKEAILSVSTADRQSLLVLNLIALDWLGWRGGTKRTESYRFRGYMTVTLWTLSLVWNVDHLVFITNLQKNHKVTGV